MEPSLILEQRLAVTPQLIMANTLLQLSATELERAVSQELAENPLLELIEVACCPRCGQAMPKGYCSACGWPGAHETAMTPIDWEYDAPSWERDDAEEGDDGIAQLASATTLAEHLLRQARLVLSPEDLPVAAFLVENLDERGFLRCDLDEAAALCGVERTRVESALSTIQGLEPVGVAARDARECLLIQLEHLRHDGIAQPLAEALLRDHWEVLGDQSPARVARTAGATVGEVQAALQFIKDNLNPYPAQADWSDLHESPPPQAAAYPRPDVVVRLKSGSVGAGYEIELPAAQAYRLRISASYLQAAENKTAFAGQDWEQWETFYARARLFIKSVEQRWQTLHQLASHLVDYQREFLASGDKYLKPLTRARLAGVLGVHESTVSRAVAGKYVQLPGGRIVPLARFFDRAAPLKEAIKELIAQEDEPLSDRALAERLAQQGHRVARRTVTKYRNALNILPSSLR
jgi:RNA polymerase sigma-54 factor